MSQNFEGQMELFSMFSGPESGQEKEPEGTAEKEKKPAAKSGNMLQKELDKIAQRAYEAKQKDTYRPVISTPEFAKKLDGKKLVMHKEAWDEEAAASVERVYYDYNIVLAIASNGEEQLHEFETAKEAVDYYFK